MSPVLFSPDHMSFADVSANGPLLRLLFKKCVAYKQEGVAYTLIYCDRDNRTQSTFQGSCRKDVTIILKLAKNKNMIKYFTKRKLETAEKMRRKVIGKEIGAW